MKEKFANIIKEIKEMNTGVIVAITQLVLTLVLTIMSILFIVNVNVFNDTSALNMLKNFQTLDVVHSISIWLIFLVLLSILVLVIQLFVNSNKTIQAKKYRIFTLGNAIFIVAIILISYFANQAKDLNSVVKIFEITTNGAKNSGLEILVSPILRTIALPYISVILLLISGYFQGYRLFNEKEIEVSDVVTNSKKVAQKSKEAWDKVAEMDKKVASNVKDTVEDVKEKVDKTKEQLDKKKADVKAAVKKDTKTTKKTTTNTNAKKDTTNTTKASK